MKYVCNICGYSYDPTVGDPDNGIAPGTAWEDIPEVGYALCAVQVRKIFLKNNHCL